MIHKKDFSVYLRAFEPDDYLLINKWRNDVEMQKLTCGPIRYVSTEMEKAWVHDKMMNNRTDIYLAICVNDDTGKMIGYTSLNDIDYINRSVCGGGIVIGDNDYRDGQALADATYMKLDYVFNELNMNRYYAKCLSEHIMSKSLMESFFFEYEGVERQAVYKCGKYHDVCRYSLLSNNFNEQFLIGNYEPNIIYKRLAKYFASKRKEIKQK